MLRHLFSINCANYTRFPAVSDNIKLVLLAIACLYSLLFQLSQTSTICENSFDISSFDVMTHRRPAFSGFNLSTISVIFGVKI